MRESILKKFINKVTQIEKTQACLLLVIILICLSNMQGTITTYAKSGITLTSNQPDAENLAVNTPVNTPAESDKDKLLELIRKKNVIYSSYSVECLQEDLDNDGAAEYFFIFTKKGTLKRDGLNYCADIWFGKGSKVQRVVKWQYILPDTYGFVTISKNYKFFQYDLSYATDSRTVLLKVKDGKCQEAFSALGGAAFRKGSADFTVLTTAYDMEFLPKDGYSCGHTWKFYYFYLDAKGFHEYGAKQISRKEFMNYKNAEIILKKINKEYSAPKKELKASFLKRSNGLVHVNISIGDKESVSNYYCTYKITKDKKLILEDSEQGKYLTASLKEIAVY